MVPEPFASGHLSPVQSGPYPDPLFPLAVVAVLALGVLFAVVRVAMIQGTGQSDGPSPDELTNCPACGARTPIADETCDYCGGPLAEGSD